VLTFQGEEHTEGGGSPVGGIALAVIRKGSHGEVFWALSTKKERGPAAREKKREKQKG